MRKGGMSKRKGVIFLLFGEREDLLVGGRSFRHLFPPPLGFLHQLLTTIFSRSLTPLLLLPYPKPKKKEVGTSNYHPPSLTMYVFYTIMMMMMKMMIRLNPSPLHRLLLLLLLLLLPLLLLLLLDETTAVHVVTITHNPSVAWFLQYQHTNK